MDRDYEDMILASQDPDRETDEDPSYDRIETRFFCMIDFAYRDCTKCWRKCYIIDQNKRRNTNVESNS